MADDVDRADNEISSFINYNIQKTHDQYEEEGPLWRKGIPYCRNCLSRIPIRRVRALPKTSLCIECAEELEEERRINSFTLA